MRKRILFVDSGFSSGGAERQCVQLMNMLVEKGYDVTCITFMDVPDHYTISPNVKRIRVAEGKAIWRKIISLEWFLLKAKMDTVVAFSQRLSVLTLPFMLLKPSVNVISSDRNLTIGSPSLYEKILLKTKLWLRANHIVPNSYSQGRYLSSKSKALEKRITVITNYTDLSLYEYQPLPHNSIIRIGVFSRYEHQKNFHGFIEMLHLLKQRTDRLFHIDWYGNYNFKSDAQQRYFETCLSKIKEYGLDKIISVNGKQ